MEYLALPLVLRDGFLPRTDVKESIVYSVGLILSTRVGTLPFDPEFGCDLWDKEYADILTANKADIRASLRNAIGKFEHRLYNLSVSFVNVPGTTARALGLKVKVTGNYREGDDERKFEATYHLE